MTSSGAEMSARVAEMRREFDAVFARPPAADPPATESLLRVTAGGTGFYVRLRELASVLPCAVLVPVPGAMRGLLGLSAVRGQILPIYALATLLELPVPAIPPRWILVASGIVAAGLGVDRVDGMERIPEAAVREAVARRTGAGRASLPGSTGSRELLELASVVAALRNFQSTTEQKR